MPRLLSDSRRWMDDGTATLLALTDLSERELAAPSLLPGWTRKHVIAHLAANADALRNLVRWAVTGMPTPMYASPDARAAGIEYGVALSATELQAWLRAATRSLAADLDGLTAAQWENGVRTSQGLPVPATEIPWMRSREVHIHAVDLAGSIHFSDLPTDFLVELCGDIATKRQAQPGPGVSLESTDGHGSWRWGPEHPITVLGPVAEIAAYLAGRPHSLVTSDGSAVPELPAWL